MGENVEIGKNRWPKIQCLKLVLEDEKEPPKYRWYLRGDKKELRGLKRNQGSGALPVGRDKFVILSYKDVCEHKVKRVNVCFDFAS